MKDNQLIQRLRASIIQEFPEWSRAIAFVKNCHGINGPKYNFKQLNKKLKKLPIQLRKNNLIIDLVRNYKTKQSSEKKELVYYCGPGKYLNFSNPWNAKSKNLGGSEEAVINISQRFEKLGWNVKVYCVTPNNQTFHIKGVTYTPYWEWLPLNPTDITVLWRDPSLLDIENINSKKIILDLHDTIDSRWLTPKRINNTHFIFVKSKFHKSILNNKSHKIVIIPNGINTLPINNNNKNKNMIVCTSSPDRCIHALLRALPIIRKQIPNAEIHWAYGFKSGIAKGGMEADERPWVKDWVEKMKTLIEQTEGFVNIGRLTQENVNYLYNDAYVFAYATRFPEIDCISITKAMAAGCKPVVVPTGALCEKMNIIRETQSVKANLSNDQKNIDYSIEDGPIFDTWVNNIIKTLQDKHNLYNTDEISNKIYKQYHWDTIVQKWIQILL